MDKLIGIVLLTYPIWSYVVLAREARARGRCVFSGRGPGLISRSAFSIISVLVFSTGFAFLFSEPIQNAIEDSRQRNREIEARAAMVAIGANVPDEQYFKALADSYRNVSPGIERKFKRQWLSTNNLYFYVERDSGGLYTLRLSGPGMGPTQMCSSTGSINGDASPDPHANLGRCADKESSMLMTLILELAGSRASHVDQILYTARTQVYQTFESHPNAKSPVDHFIFTASIKPARYAALGSARANAGDFVKANKSILRDTFSGWSCPH